MLGSLLRGAWEPAHAQRWCDRPPSPPPLQVVISFLFDRKTTQTTEVQKDAPTPVVRSLSARARLLGGVIVGDFFHNLADGVFIGSAFLGCGTSFGFKVAGATVTHELAQELGDFFLLTDPAQGNLSIKKALALNAVSGLSILIGAVIVLAQETVDSKATGMLLAFGGGVYIQVAAGECMPRMYSLAKTPCLRLVSLLVLVIGATAIALVLLDHEHCVPAAAAAAGGAHAGHNHP